MLASYYCDLITKAKQEVNDNAEDIDYLFKLTMKHEANILKCLTFMILEHKELMSQNQEKMQFMQDSILNQNLNFKKSASNIADEYFVPLREDIIDNDNELESQMTLDVFGK